MSSTLQPFVSGDLFVAATLLDNPQDDHAGRGRILQFGADLKPKGEMFLSDTTHLVGGLKFDPQGVLWAFDSQEFGAQHSPRRQGAASQGVSGARFFARQLCGG